MGEQKRRIASYEKRRNDAQTLAEFQAIGRTLRPKRTSPPVKVYVDDYTPIRSDPDLKPDKGQKNGSCNRTACQKPLVRNWFNRSTRAYYCSNCAHELNRANPPRMCVGWLSPKELERGDTLCVLED